MHRHISVITAIAVAATASPINFKDVFNAVVDSLSTPKDITPNANSPFAVNMNHDNKNHFGTLSASASSLKDCNLIRQKDAEFCDGLNGEDYKNCRDGVNIMADSCEGKMQNGESVFNFNFEFKATNFAKQINQVSNEAPVANPLSIATAFIDNAHVGAFSAKAHNVGDCNSLRAENAKFCDHLTQHGDCRDGFNRVVDSCESAFSQGAVSFDFYYNFDASNVGSQNVLQQNSNNPVSTNPLNIATAFVNKDHVGAFSAHAYNTGDCDTLRAEDAKFCDGLTGQTYVNCRDGFNGVADSCQGAFSQGSNLFDFYYKFDASQGESQMQSQNVQFKNEFNSGSEPVNFDRTINTNFDSDTRTGVFKANAYNVDDCNDLRKEDAKFCDGLESNWDKYRNCRDGFNLAADSCVQALSSNEVKVFSFGYEFQA